MNSYQLLSPESGEKNLNGRSLWTSEQCSICLRIIIATVSFWEASVKRAATRKKLLYNVSEAVKAGHLLKKKYMLENYLVKYFRLYVV